MTCIASMRSMTYAMKAKHALTDQGIPCEITSLDPSMTARGCAYGVKFNCVYESAVKNTLTKSGISYSQMLTLPL